MLGGVDLFNGKTDIEKWQVTFNLIPKNIELTLKNLNGIVVSPTSSQEGQIIYDLQAGIYTYTASADGYITKEDIRIEIYQKTTIKVELESSLEIVPFSTATDEQIEKMLNAHYSRRNRYCRTLARRGYKASTIRSNGSWYRSKWKPR